MIETVKRRRGEESTDAAREAQPPIVCESVMSREHTKWTARRRRGRRGAAGGGRIAHTPTVRESVEGGERTMMETVERRR